MKRHYTDKEISELLKQLTIVVDSREQVNGHVNADRNKSDTPCICRKVYYGERGTKNCIDCWNEIMPEETGNE